MNGGIKINEKFKVGALEQAPLPKKVILPLLQRMGNIAKPLVKVGDKVKTAQIIARTDDNFSIPVHATISGEVTSINEQKILNTSSICITIQSDDKDEWLENEGCGQDFMTCNNQTLIKHLQNSGIVGLGGAGFPTHIKANVQNCNTLIINACECEPDISADDVLIQNYYQEVFNGIKILQKITNAKRTILAIEDNKQTALKILKDNNHHSNIEIISVPTIYTSGAEKILIKNLLNIEIPNNKFAIDVGVLCQNVSTVKAIYDAIVERKPLISRIITFTGSAIDNPKNYEVRLGTPFADIIKLSKPKDNFEIKMNGPMMGLDIDNQNTPICKITSAIFLNTPKTNKTINPCVRCGKCNEVCPINLLPQQLYWFAKSDDINQAVDYNLMSCFECNCCSFVCPSNIPLVDYYKKAKVLYKNKLEQERKANIARERFEFREYRLERNKKERKEMMARKKAELKQKIASDEKSQEKIANAMKMVNKK
ncbi:Electron transport complex protein RnfC [hydrothermal vent metagenome]|uniref:Electron transport complex protein RnfC n=1 Tax=hydrothermal vent metagenome TaxID=652676 RepID=A0A1W1CPR4_9ZZZZ